MDSGTSLKQFFVLAVIAFLCVVFAVSFGGNQAEGCASGGATSAAQVSGHSITPGEFDANYALISGNQNREQLRLARTWRTVLDGIVERELLAEEARELGFQVSPEDTLRRIADEGTIRLSMAGGEAIEMRLNVNDEDGNFDPDTIRNLANRYGRSVTEFTSAQQREELAERFRQTIRATANVSEAEVWEAYERESDSATISYMRFRVPFYVDRVDVNDAAVEAWMAENGDAVDAAYEENERRYTDLDPQVRTRRILFQAAEGNEEARELARENARAALARINAGESFADVAQDVSEDTGSASSGGDLGFRARGVSEAAYDDAAFEMEVGEISDLVETPAGVNLIELVATREGDVPVEEAKRELAEGLYVQAQAEAFARADAEAAREALAGNLELEGFDRWMRRRLFGAPEVIDTDEEGNPVYAELPPLPAEAAQLVESSSFGRDGRPITGVENTELVESVFERTMEEPLADAPIEVGDSFVIYQLTDRVVPTREEFEGEVHDRLRSGLLRAKQRQALSNYVRELREAAIAAGDVSVTVHELVTEVEGNGEVRTNPAGIECGESCSASFEYANLVELRASPGPGARFLGWSGACSGASDTCVVEMKTSQTVRARFRGGESTGGETSENSEE